MTSYRQKNVLATLYQFAAKIDAVTLRLDSSFFKLAERLKEIH